MKKTALILLALMLGCVPLAACGKTDNKTPEEEQTIETPLPEIPETHEEPETPAVSEVPEVPEVPEVKEPEIARAEYILIKTDNLNVRTGAGTSYSSLGQVEKNVLLHYAGTENGWYRTYYRGKTAYVSAGAQYTALMSLDAGSEKIEKVIEVGLKQLGVPYVYGATRLHDGKGNLLKGFSTSKFDCSSLMQYIFYEGAGVLLDVNTRTQIKQGKTVSKNELKRGDLMFFTNASRKNNVGIERVGHVALYLGDNYILHTASDYAKIEQISSTRWGYFIEGRRML